MERFDLYQDIAQRTGGNIYIGVIGGVRTGKSTFIKRFMDTVVLKYMPEGHEKERMLDELPQSASGRTIMTTEPKFIPNEPVELTLDGQLHLRVRLIDCVGYLVAGAQGHMDGDGPRMVQTPWSRESMPFEQAAELGTRKVICDHSTIGIVVTTDGSITGIARENYIPAEERVITELKELGKPFVVLLNSTHPSDPETQALASSLSEQYDVAVRSVDCAQLTEEDIYDILEEVLLAFPVRQVELTLPRWVDTLDVDHPIKQQILSSARHLMAQMDRIGGVKALLEEMGQEPWLRKLYIDEIDLGEGRVAAEGALAEGLFYQVLSETIGMELSDDCQLIHQMQQLGQMKQTYDKLENALAQTQQQGYGIVPPTASDIVLEEPELYRQGSRYGIRLRAKGRSLHIIQAQIETEVSPIIGTEEQTRQFLEELLAKRETDPDTIWEWNLFGRSLESLVNDGLMGKLYQMPPDVQMQLQQTLEKILSEGNGGLICILL